ncbi:conserved exported hypothetical protein [Burkholderiales bacterium 8X]|nr:conserved exported hypothetical protein [Burkholderiales bacterium 8X]
MRLLDTFLRLCCCATVVAAAMPAGAAGTAVIDNPGTGTNRIEVTGNRAENVQAPCADGSTRANAQGANVNSVNVDRRALQGKTVIVTGRNSRDVHADVNCERGARPAGNVNSVNIR